MKCPYFFLFDVIGR